MVEFYQIRFLVRFAEVFLEMPRGLGKEFYRSVVIRLLLRTEDKQGSSSRTSGCVSEHARTLFPSRADVLLGS